MHPIKVVETNFCYTGPTDEIADLPVKIEGRGAYSVWELTNEERKLIAEGANIRLGILAQPIPPVLLHLVVNTGFYQKVPDPCMVCGEESSSEIHGSLSHMNCHAFRSTARTVTA